MTEADFQKRDADRRSTVRKMKNLLYGEYQMARIAFCVAQMEAARPELQARPLAMTPMEREAAKQNMLRVVSTYAYLKELFLKYGGSVDSSWDPELPVGLFPGPLLMGRAS